VVLHFKDANMVWHDVVAEEDDEEADVAGVAAVDDAAGAAP